MTKDEMVGWHHRFNGHEFAQSAGESEGQRSLVSCSPGGCKESDTIEQLTTTARKTYGFPGGSVVKNPPAHAGDMGLTTGQGRSPGGRNGNPLQGSS